ncbi:MAG: hypothetical protein GX624_01350 [Actinobacteria bacterium]|nr:hypothetical protein [Actinomycetota bacterium]
MAQQPARPTIRVGQALALTVFFASATFLMALFVSGIGSASDSLQTAGASVSTLCAALAAGAVLVDAVDLWLRGRALSPRTVGLLRIVVLVAMLGALVASFVGENPLVIWILVPVLFIHLFIIRRRPEQGGAGRSVSGVRSGGTAKSRQRRGGRKRR